MVFPGIRPVFFVRRPWLGPKLGSVTRRWRPVLGRCSVTSKWRRLVTMTVPIAFVRSSTSTLVSPAFKHNQANASGDCNDSNHSEPGPMYNRDRLLQGFKQRRRMPVATNDCSVLWSPAVAIHVSRISRRAVLRRHRRINCAGKCACCIYKQFCCSCNCCCCVYCSCFRWCICCGTRFALCVHCGNVALLIAARCCERGPIEMDTVNVDSSNCRSYLQKIWSARKTRATWV
mmetsp:Transcript_126684/g.246896  ORF Transcript_126684/g.246896 Transcript_126684/m.246896 type:complete len:231 (+) Transcript_126684:132-824(+)